MQRYHILNFHKEDMQLKKANWTVHSIPLKLIQGGWKKGKGLVHLKITTNCGVRTIMAGRNFAVLY